MVESQEKGRVDLAPVQADTGLRPIAHIGILYCENNEY